ncbi:MAG: PAS domain S-box protein [Pseudomonadota bacterium]
MPSLRIRTYLIFSISAVALLLTAAMTTLYSRQFEEHTLKSLSQYGLTVSRNVSFAAIDHIITENFASLQELTTDFSRLPNVASLEISDTYSHILAASDPALLGTTRHHQHSGPYLLKDEQNSVHIDRDDNSLLVYSRIEIGDMVMGFCTVELSLAEMKIQIGQIRQKGAITGLTFWMMAVILGYFLSRKLTKPVQSFMQATEKISQGNFGISLPSPRGVHELEKFSEVLSIMTRAIAAREEALQQSERKYRHLFQRAMEGIFACDADGIFQEINPAMVAIFGYGSKKELLSRNLLTDIFASQLSTETFQQLIKGQISVKDYEVQMVRKNSEHIFVSLSCQAIKNGEGKVTRYEGMLRDITRQKKAAEEIARMRNYLNNIIESMPSMLITVNDNSEVTQWNSAAYKATGIPSAEAMGKKIWNIAPFFKKYGQLIQNCKTSREPVKLHREQMNQPNEQTYNLTIFPLIANGVEGVTIRLDDITELEMKERQLRQAQKMESVGTLAGGLAHDFNNVLGGILGNLSLIQFRMDKHETIPENELREYIARMNSAGFRAADMVRQLLALSRKQDVDLIPVDLNLSIRHVRKIGENTFDKSIKIIVQPAETPAYVMADPTQIEQVILNICINAAHAMTIMRENDAWGGTLIVGLRKIEADPIFAKTHPEAKEGPYWQLSISDTGVGMDTKTVSKIFDPFFTTKEKNKGTGLGLAMAYNIVRQIEGFIDVYSEEGLGSTFNIYIPLLEKTTLALGEEKKPKIYRGQGGVLVIDDDEILRETARAILESVGYTVFTANDGHEGVAVYRDNQEKIHVVMLDLVMPIMSGREAYVELRKINNKVKVLLVSGFRHDTRVEEVLQLGVDKFLQKPYTIENLTRSLQELLADAQQRCSRK